MTTGVSNASAGPAGATSDAGSGTDAPTSTSGPDSATNADADSGSEGSSEGSRGSTGPSAECGNAVIEADEACDGVELGDMTCADMDSFVGGVLACDAECAFDTAGCLEKPKAPVEVCENINLAIPDLGGAVTSSVTLPAGGTVLSATIGVALTHTYIGDLSIDVEHGGITVRVYNRECGLQDNMNLVFDDDGVAIACDASVSGAATLPSEALSGFDGAAAGGLWTFSFQDNAGADVGTVTQICVRVVF